MMRQSTAFVILFFLLFMLFLGLLYVATARADDVSLAWDGIPPPVDGYRVYQRSADADYDFDAPVWEGPDTKCTITGLVPATQYHFVVRAYLKDIDSKNSNEVGFIPPLQAPGNFRIDLNINVKINVNDDSVVK